MTFLWIGLMVLGGLFCAAGLLMGYLGLLSALFPEKVRTREVGEVVTADLWKLRICRFRRGRTEGEPVLLVHGLGTNHHNFTEPAGGCLVDYLVERGYDCWALDLRGTRSSKAPFERDPKATSLDDFMLYDIPAAIEHIRRATGYAKVHYVGHSLGGMMLYAYAQAFGHDTLATGTAIGVPIGFDDVRARAGLRLLPLIKRYPRLAQDLLRGALPFIAPLRVNIGVFPMNGRNVHSSLKVSEFYNMIDVPSPNVMTEMAQMVRRKVWRMKGGALDVKAGLNTLNFPLLVVVGARDPFTPPARMHAFVDALPTQDKRLVVCSREAGCRQDYGHCDLAFGLDGAKSVFRPIADWLAEHPVRERLQHSAEVDAHLMTPLDGDARADILSGNPFEKARDATPVHRSIPEDVPPAAVEAPSEALRERQAALQGFALRVAGSAGTRDSSPPAAGERRSNAYMNKLQPIEPEPEDEPVQTAPKATPAKPKAKAAQARTTKVTATKGSPAKASPAKTDAKQAPKPAAPKKTAAAKPAVKQDAKPAAKATTKSKTKAKAGTLSVLQAASEELKKLDKKK